MVADPNGIVSTEDLATTEELTENLPFDISAAVLEGVDLQLPDDYSDEIYAEQLLDAITQYHTFTVQYRALRNQGDHTKAEIAAKMAAVCRAQAALIQSEHPNTIKLYKELAHLRVVQARSKRPTLD